ncbi:tyrosine phosphatase family-domain-containing protein [Coniochaeta sp. 2T2.1]|nr:tyrosine phosphatase family-domain-containing protein [Coniochaeta sp. 2T2.1]
MKLNQNNLNHTTTKSDESCSQTQNIESSKASTSGIVAQTATAMEDPSNKAYSRRGSASGPTATSIERAVEATRAGDEVLDFDSTTFVDDELESSSIITTASLKTYKLDGLHEDDRPINFGRVIPGVYRSSFPKTEDYPFFKKLRLKTVVTLVQKDFPADYKPFLSDSNIKHHVFDMEGTKKATIPIQTMSAILRLALNPRNYPLLIHCNRGRHRTGCVVAALRKLHGWHLDAVLDEYRAFAEPKIRECDVEYITAFDTMQLANLWSPESTFPHRFRRYYRATAFACVVLLIWIYSGSEMSATLVARVGESPPRPTA